MWKSISAVLLFLSVPMYGQCGFTPCDDVMSSGDIVKPAQQVVTQITKDERSVLDVSNDIVNEYEAKVHEAQDSLEVAKEYRAMMTKAIIESHGITDTTDMTVNGLYILYNPYQNVIHWDNWSSPWGVTTVPGTDGLIGVGK